MIWIIGKNGMLGREICNLLNCNNIKYIASGSEIDIYSIDCLKSFISRYRIDTIINCSAYTKVDMAEDDVENCYRVNAYGIENIINIAKEKKANFIHFSTDYVFDGLASNPYNEDDIANPINVYGKSKLLGEQYALDYDKSIVIRISWLYGIYGINFVSKMINLMNIKYSIKVVNDQFGSPTNTLDVANFVIYLLNKKIFKYGLYHYSNNGSISWYDFACNIYELGSKFNIIKNNCIINSCNSIDFETRAMRPKYTVLSLEKIKNTFNIEILDYKKSLTNYFNILTSK